MKERDNACASKGKVNVFEKQLDLKSYRIWAGCLVVAHILAAVAAMNGAEFLGKLDTAIVLFLAWALAARSRDIGWPVWMAPTFLLVTMLLSPLLLLVYLIATQNKTADFLGLISIIGLVSAPLNLILLVVAGLVPGKPAPLAATLE
ncbi:hypothetical protein ACQR1I_36490 [Bradyrhizobium sp. HKCCYLS2038]|uniref:hypothetical protein n=1 Tax=unclassified Bradyrhizobium TaxID=2631580 RepID=UPI003EBAE148